VESADSSFRAIIVVLTRSTCDIRRRPVIAGFTIEVTGCVDADLVGPTQRTRPSGAFVHVDTRDIRWVSFVSIADTFARDAGGLAIVCTIGVLTAG
jgi:hypothetical protein